MYTVYVVDDESLMLDNIISSINWLDNGFEVIGFNTNPSKAIVEIIEKKPHVVFSDLKMPIMNGIEMIEIIKQNGVDSEFVILSAFGDFEASRNFFRMDGFDYILKPLQVSDSESVLENLSRKLSTKNKLFPSVLFVQTQSKSFDDLVRYVTDTFNKKHSLKSLSEKFNLNPTYICNLFTKHYESTLTIFITSLRMRESSRLIKETDAPLKEISIACGYSDYFYFCRTFKTYFGVPPTQYRIDNKKT